jgi:hypothetical protein
MPASGSELSRHPQPSTDILTSFEGLSRGLIGSLFGGRGEGGPHSGSDYHLQVIEDNADMDAVPHAKNGPEGPFLGF